MKKLKAGRPSAWANQAEKLIQLNTKVPEIVAKAWRFPGFKQIVENAARLFIKEKQE